MAFAGSLPPCVMLLSAQVSSGPVFPGNLSQSSQRRMLSQRAAERGSASPPLTQLAATIPLHFQGSPLHCTPGVCSLFQNLALVLLRCSQPTGMPGCPHPLHPACRQTHGAAIQGTSGASLRPSLICTPEPSRPSHTHTQGIRKNSMARAEAINQLPSRISSQPQAEPSVPGVSNIIKGGKAGRRDRHRLVKYFREGKKMGELVLVGHISHNSWTHNLKKALELLFA